MTAITPTTAYSQNVAALPMPPTRLRNVNDTMKLKPQLAIVQIAIAGPRSSSG